LKLFDTLTAFKKRVRCLEASTMELVPWLVGYFLIKVVLRLAIGGTAWDHTSLARQLLPSSPPT
jgi:hypothetical protein